MTKVFISYSSIDSIFADLTKMKLEGAGIQVWLDSGELKAGEEWRDAIDRGISSADVIVVILTSSSCKSSYVTYEWGFALGKGKPVIPILLESSDVHPRLGVLQYLDFQDQKSFPWAKLTSEINECANEIELGSEPAYLRDITTKDLQEVIARALMPISTKIEVNKSELTQSAIKLISSANKHIMLFGRDLSWAGRYSEAIKERINKGIKVEVFAEIPRTKRAIENVQMLEELGVRVRKISIDFGIKFTMVDYQDPSTARLMILYKERNPKSTVQDFRYTCEIHDGKESMVLWMSLKRLYQAAVSESGRGQNASKANCS